MIEYFLVVLLQCLEATIDFMKTAVGKERSEHKNTVVNAVVGEVP